MMPKPNEKSATGYQLQNVINKMLIRLLTPLKLLMMKNKKIWKP